MHRRTFIPPLVLSVARRQGGAITREQCLAHGLTLHQLGRLVGDGLWVRVAAGVFCTGGAEPSWTSLAWAGLMVGGEKAMLAGPAAAHLYGLVATAPTPITILIPHQLRTHAGWPWQYRRARQLPRPRGVPPRTPVEETVLDLVARQPMRAAHWVTAAVNARLTTSERLREALADRSRMPGRAALADLLADVEVGAMSKLELVYLRAVERAHGLPVGRRQQRSDRYVIDVDYGGLLVELDGRVGHAGAGKFRDMARDNHHTLQDKHTLRFGWDDCRYRPCTVAEQVAVVLHARGWSGTRRPCRRCA